MEFYVIANGSEVLDVKFGNLALADSFFDDLVLDLGLFSGPADLTFGYNLVADGDGGLGFDFGIRRSSARALDLDDDADRLRQSRLRGLSPRDKRLQEARRLSPPIQ